MMPALRLSESELNLLYLERLRPEPPLPTLPLQKEASKRAWEQLEIQSRVQDGAASEGTRRRGKLREYCNVRASGAALKEERKQVAEAVATVAAAAKDARTRVKLGEQ